MKAKIVSVKHYYAQTEDGEIYDVNINNEILNRIIDKEEFIEGDIIVKEEQCRYTDGTYARSYTETETFVPHIKITEGEFLQKTKITTREVSTEQIKKVGSEIHKKHRVIPHVPKEERSQLHIGYGSNKKIELPKVDSNKSRYTKDETKLKKD